MKLPTMRTQANPSEEQIIRFAGLDRRYGAGAGVLADADGVTTDRFPSLSARCGTETVTRYEEPQRCFAYAGGFLVIEASGSVKWNGTEVFKLSDYLPEGTETPLPEQLLLAGINSRIVLFPHKVAVNVQDAAHPVVEQLACAISGNTAYTVTLNTFLDAEGQKYDLIHTDSLRFAQLNINDTISIDGLSVTVGAITVRYLSADGHTVGFDGNTLDAGITTSGTAQLTFSRSVPDLDTLCESGNRLWGTEGNTIRACALGDPANWNRYDALTDDAYAVAVASDGAFTACSHYGTHIVFFKEQIAHKVYGSKPANFQTVTAVIPGVKAGAARTLATVGGVLYYAGVGGIYAYDGDAPTCISAPFGGADCKAQFAAGAAQKYYLYADIGQGDALYAYDTVKQLWCPESHDWLCDIAYTGGRLYQMQAEGDLQVLQTDYDHVHPTAWWV